MIASHKHMLIKDMSRLIAKLTVISSELKSWHLEIYELNPTTFGQQVAETIKYHAFEIQNEADKLRGVIDSVTSSKAAGKPMFQVASPTSLAVVAAQEPNDPK